MARPENDLVEKRRSRRDLDTGMPTSTCTGVRLSFPLLVLQSREHEIPPSILAGTRISSNGARLGVPDHGKMGVGFVARASSLDSQVGNEKKERMYDTCKKYGPYHVQYSHSVRRLLCCLASARIPSHPVVICEKAHAGAMLAPGRLEGLVGVSGGRRFAKAVRAAQN